MKSLVLYYSNNGYTMEIAEEIAENIGSDIERIIPVEDIVTKEKNNYFSIFQINLFFDKAKIMELSKNLNDYDLIFIGTPVWFGNYVPFLRTVLLKYTFKDKDIGIFCCCDENSKKTIQRMKKKLNGANIIDELEIIQKDGDYININKVKQWSKSLYGKVERMKSLNEKNKTI